MIGMVIIQIIGLAENQVVNCYSVGIINSNRLTTKGGLIGTYTSILPVLNSYYDSEISGQSDTGKGEPKTTTELKVLNTFTN